MRRELLGLVLLAAACDHGRRLSTPLPEQFRAFTLTDEVLDRTTLEGRPWVISVWRPGCQSCLRQLATLDKVKQRYAARGVGFVALSLETDEAKVFEAAARAEVDSTLAYGEEVMGPLGLKRLPSTVFIDKDLTIVASLSGESDEGDLEKWLTVAAP